MVYDHPRVAGKHVPYPPDLRIHDPGGVILSMRSLRPEFAVAGVILTPFATVGMEFRNSLLLQAAIISGLVIATLPDLATPEGRQQILKIPSSVMIGLISFVIAAVFGTLLGVFRGNSTAALAGQALSMILLPTAAVGALAGRASFSMKKWKTGLFAAMTAGCWIQLLWGLVTVFVFGKASRLFLPNAVSMAGPALMGLCFSLASLRDTDIRLRHMAWLTAFSLFLLITASGLRSLWILAPIAAVGLLVACWGLRSRETLIMLSLVGCLAFTVCTWVIMSEAWVARERSDFLQQSPCSLFPEAGSCIDGSLDLEADESHPLRIDAPIDLPEAGAWRVRVRGHGEGSGHIVIALVFMDYQGHILDRIGVSLAAGEGSGLSSTVGTTPPGWTKATLRLSGWKHPVGRWHIDAIELSALESPMTVLLVKQARALGERVGNLLAALKGGQIDRDATLGFRWHESRRIIEELGNSSTWEFLLGHGLGATIELDIDGFDNRGNWIHYGEVNYIHNWYLFLLYKLGLVGLILVLGALTVWVGWTLRQIGRMEEPSVRAFLIAAAASWIVYAVWSLTSPEILDFRMAPLWGWLLAVSVLQPGQKVSSR